jgi:hypothetical protein
MCHQRENIVIMGTNVAGLATMLTLCTGGTSLPLFKDGWRVLDAVGVTDELRNKYLSIQGCVTL